MPLKTIPEIQEEMQLLYKQWRVGSLSRFQLAAGTAALQGMAKMVKDEFDVQTQRIKLNMNNDNQRQRGGTLLIPVDVSLAEFQSSHSPEANPQATIYQITQSVEHQEKLVKKMSVSQAETQARSTFFTQELENIDQAQTPNLMEELERRYAKQNA